MSYVATINVPGYLPMDDEPPVFDTAAEAWSYLADERRRGEDDTDENGLTPYSETVDALQARADAAPVGDDTGTVPDEGTVYGSTPGYPYDAEDGHIVTSHDLGLAYSVTWADHGDPNTLDW